jgi:copper transporter 1
MSMGDMGGMGGMGGMANMSSLGMTFFSAQNTPLFAMSWQPSSPGGYAGTVIFLIILAILSRGIAALRTDLESRWHHAALRRRYIVVAAPPGSSGDGGSAERGLKQTLGERVLGDPNGSTATLTANGVDECVRVVQAPRRGPVPWRLSVDAPRAGLVTVQAGVMYLLMVAVMTMNVGYFMAVLAGTLIGELAVGRWNHLDVEHTH